MKKKKKNKLQRKKQPDILKQIKYRGYCWANTPPGDKTTMQDLVSFAKFFLCKASNTLWKDSVWELYTDEEILIEYYAHLFSSDEAIRREFEVSINAGIELYGEEIFDWLDRKVKENQEEMKKKSEELPEKIEFSPEVNIDKER